MFRLLLAVICFMGGNMPLLLLAQQPANNIIEGIDPQPLLSQSVRLKEALDFLGSSLSPEAIQKLEVLKKARLNNEVTKQLQQILDPYCLAHVSINPEGRVKVDRGSATATLIQSGWKSFLVKIHNEAGATSQLKVESANSLPAQHRSSFTPRVKEADLITQGESANRFMDMQMYYGRPLLNHLSGFKLEYAVVQLYSKDAGQREVEIAFNAGQGSQDIGFRNSVSVLFNILPSVKVKLDVKDDDGSPAMASFVITDSIERTGNKLSSVYPLPSRRVAAYDEYPDFFFQPQVYRKDGEHVLLPPGKYTVTYTRGPEYIPQTKEIVIPTGKEEVTISFRLKRWIDVAKLGWYSADHHVHAAGCSHYDSPEEGVPPTDMWRQSLGEDLKVAAVLTWGPSWYHQKSNFTGKDNPLSTDKNIIRYDVEVSGFPSSHAGHLVLLRLKEDDYPGTTSIEEWPTWTLPVLQWGKKQGGIVGYAHSGWGLMPIQPTNELPNYNVPHMDYIGANEFIVTVAHKAVDFYSAGDTPAPWELNMWYHTLNCGFKTMLSGETDFPCITDERVGQARSYFKAGKMASVNYNSYVEAIKKGSSYVSDGGSHIMNFSVNGKEIGVGESEIAVKGKQTIKLSADVTAWLPEEAPKHLAGLAQKPLTEVPYWHVERARIGASRKIKVELIVNGIAVDATEITADGNINKVNFNYPVERSSWAALRIMASAHSNPFFIKVDGKPVQEPKSAQWCVEALDQCWKKKEPNIKTEEKTAAKAAYDQARLMYQQMAGSK